MEGCCFVFLHDIDYWQCIILSTLKVCCWLIGMAKRMLVSKGFKSLITFWPQKSLALEWNEVFHYHDKMLIWKHERYIYIYSIFHKVSRIWIFGLVGMVAWASLRWPDPCLRIVPRSKIDALLGKQKSLAGAVHGCCLEASLRHESFLP